MFKSFKPSPVKCRELFSAEGDLYRIPRYQRPYSWKPDHINQLLDDLHEAWAKQPESPYFLGSVILVGEDNSERLSILDGQQRITTLTILYAVFHHHFQDSLSPENTKRVHTRLIERSLDKPRLHSDKQTDFERSVVYRQQLDQDNRYTNAANIILANLQTKFDDNPTALNDFFAFIDRKVELIRIYTENLTYAVRVFQTINTRGKDLTVSDLVKSHLLGQLEDDEDKEDVVDVWQEITTKIDENYDLLDFILSMYRLYRRTTKAKGSVYEELKPKLDANTPKDTVRDIRNFVLKYVELDRSRDRWIFMLDHLTHELYWKTLLITSKVEEIGYFHELKKDLVAFYYSYWIAGYTAEKIKLPSIELLKKVKSDAPYSSIRKVIQDRREEHSILDRVRDNLQSEDVTDQRWHKPLLIAIEYLMSTGRKIERIDSSRELHREHVLPKNFPSAKDKYDYWRTRFDDDDAAKLKDTIGNLVPLQYDLNSAAAQKPFPKKVEIYRGNKDKPQSSFDITMRVANTEQYSDWTPQAIRDNSRYLITKAAELLRLPDNALLANDSS